jgi:ubiquinone/menaquinone biosynthesis C-methylase UbiE
MGNPDVNSLRALVGFNRRLYTSPSGKGRQWAFTGSAVVLESINPVAGYWRPISVPGFGDENNQVIFEMAVFNDHLYAGTANPKNGYQVWKTKAEGNPPYKWQKVINNGAYRGKLNQAVMCMFVFRNALYIGGGIRRGGYDREFDTGPAAAELLRVYPDDSWELVAGEQRRTPQGLAIPISGLGPGFGNPFTGYIWSMAEYNGYLYVGTFDSTVMLSFVDPQKLPPETRQRFGPGGLQHLAERQGGFDLWSSFDGIHWNRVTGDGFGNKYNYGVRTMAGTPEGLFLGAANPFAPEIAAKTSAGWSYVPNPRGGLEVWRGLPRHSVEIITPSSTTNSLEDLQVAINRHYDRSMYKPFFREQSDFANFGYWEPGILTPTQASQNLMEKLLAFIPKESGTILDVACGKGATTRHLLKYFPPTAVTGINISEKQLETCRSNAPGCKFLLMSATDMKFDDESFDDIICVEAAFHFKTREKFLREALRVLKPGGRLVLSDILLSRPSMQNNPLYPEENSVKDQVEYGQMFSRVGFNSSNIIDVTEECWKRFYRRFVPSIENKFMAGQLDPGTYARLGAWIFSGIQSIEYYVLAYATKGPNGPHT